MKTLKYLILCNTGDKIETIALYDIDTKDYEIIAYLDKQYFYPDSIKGMISNLAYSYNVRMIQDDNFYFNIEKGYNYES